ncbi:MAG TPA: rod shape-determining protein MreC [Synechococcales cyanobacterium M55_K2018_004]|nr:rod shape-determining protein MreC [Synechococcales cyanobacterium M55_K2018_004]
MFTLRRWWSRQGIGISLVLLALGSAWMLRQTQGSLLFEIYQTLARPFETAPPSPDTIRQDARLLELQQRLVELESQNQQLKELLGYTATQKQQGVIAPIIGRSSDHWWQQVVLGRGSQDGIRQGDVVSGAGGIVGRVVQVTPSTSRVLLISDPTSQVGVLVSRSRYSGVMRGQAGNRAVVEFFDKAPDVKPGDVLTTSSFSQLFPPGLPIGRIESIDLSKSPAPEAVVVLSAPISHLEWVTVVSGKSDGASNP